MRARAVLMALAMMTTALAGCTGTDGVTEVDEDALNELIQNNLQDFINNTTVIVNQDFHYHNNTTYVVDDGDYSSTVVNEYNNTTNIDGGEVNNHDTDNSVNNYNGSGVGAASTMHMLTVSWDIEEEVGYNPADKIVMAGNSSLLFLVYYNSQTVEFRNLNCTDWINFANYQPDDWRTYLQNNFGTDWDDLEDVARDINEHWGNNQNGGYDAFEQCNYDDWTYLTGASWHEPASHHILYEIELEIGQAMSLLSTSWNFGAHGSQNEIDVDVNCDDGYSTGLGNGTNTGYIGGQANCTVTGSTHVQWRLVSAGYQLDEHGDYLRPDYVYLYNYAIGTRDTAPFEFAVYFTIHDVVVYDQGTE